MSQRMAMTHIGGMVSTDCRMKKYVEPQTR